MTYVTDTQQALFGSFVKDSPLPELTPVEISFYDHEIYCGNKLIAQITYKEDLTQPWMVMVNGTEIYRANTWAKAWRYICTHHKDGTLPEQHEETPAATATDNEIQCQIANECEKQGFELLDDGIYSSDFKVGEVGFDGVWWYIRTLLGRENKVFCQSVADAVEALALVGVESMLCEDLLDRPFDQLTDEEWQNLLEYAPVTEVNKWVAA
ncbi:hypothetical protein [Nostoc sp. CCY0012]|uniref:hypothetical protein n=1 Tax=Nostoc sp. CCY0012 TaxID=1056123 RepID=UPI0039C65C89